MSAGESRTPEPSGRVFVDESDREALARAGPIWTTSPSPLQSRRTPSAGYKSDRSHRHAAAAIGTATVHLLGGVSRGGLARPPRCRWSQTPSEASASSWRSRRIRKTESASGRTRRICASSMTANSVDSVFGHHPAQPESQQLLPGSASST